MPGTGPFISIFITPLMANVIGGALTFYLVAPAWATVVRKPVETGRFEIGAALLGLTTAVAGIVFGVQAENRPDHLLDGFPSLFCFIFPYAAGELSIMLWLLIKGARSERVEHQPSEFDNRVAGLA